MTVQALTTSARFSQSGLGSGLAVTAGERTGWERYWNFRPYSIGLQLASTLVIMILSV